MRAFSIEPAEDAVVVTAPSAHRPAHLLTGVPLVLYLVLQLPMVAVWAGAFREVLRTLGPLAGIAAFLGGMALTFGPGLAGVFLIVYEFAGVERITIGPRRVRVTYAVGRVGWPRWFRLSRIRDPRVVDAPGSPSWWSPARGGIAFDLAGRTRGFGAALTSAEAERVLAVLEERLPEPEPEADEEETQEG